MTEIVTIETQTTSVTVEAPDATSVEIQQPGGAGPPGPANRLDIGTVVTGSAGSDADAEITGNPPVQTLDLTIPRGDKGDKGDDSIVPGPAGHDPAVTVGTVTTGPAGSDAEVVDTDPGLDVSLDFTLPRGDKGDVGPVAEVTVESTTTGAPGSAASVSDVDPGDDVALAFVIPRGDKGEPGDDSTVPGDPGHSPVVTVESVTTGDPGTDAAVTDTDAGLDVALAFTIPRGDKGDPGNDSTVEGPAGPGVPDGGLTGQVLGKVSDADQDTEWIDVAASEPEGPLTGGTELELGDYKVHKFTASGDLIVNEQVTVEFLSVGGGGAGGPGRGGGGGGGAGVVTGSVVLTPGTYGIVVGAGGATAAASGAASQITGQATTVGPGGGGGGGEAATPKVGGCGGGGGRSYPTGAAGTVGFAGGNSTYTTHGGGGGGMTAAGGNGSADAYAGPGGQGIAYDWDGSSVVYGSGGGGGIMWTGPTPAPGGTNAGTGGTGDTASTVGVANTGGGGGGGRTYDQFAPGGSGIFMVRYSTDAPAPDIALDDLTDVDTSTTAPAFGQALVWDDSQWMPGDVATPDPGPATGGTETDVDGYRIHTFTSSGTLTLPSALSGVEYLIVGGGGGGGARVGGGGGAGGVLQDSVGLNLSSGAYPIIVGAGTSRAPADSKGANGEDTTALGFIAVGGGGGSKRYAGNGFDGGSGGGSVGNTEDSPTVTQSLGVAGQGNNGGCASDGSNFYCGGGGGAGSSPGTSEASCYHGGAGIQSDISGTALWYAGGGGGTRGGLNSIGNGGSGVGGRGSQNSSSETGSGHDGVANTGSGGGGTYYDGYSGGAGAEGIVIIRYPYEPPALPVIDDLSDVDTTTVAPTDGQALVWDDANSEWVPGDRAAGGAGAEGATFWAFQPGSPVTTENLRTSTSGSDYAAMTSSVSKADLSPMTVYRIDWVPDEADTYELFLDGVSQGTKVLAADQVGQWDIDPPVEGAALTPIVVKFQGTAARKFHFNDAAGPLTVGPMVIGDWLEAPSNTPAMAVVHDGLALAEITTDGGIAEVHVGDEEPTGDEVLWFKTDASPWAPFFMTMGG